MVLENLKKMWFSRTLSSYLSVDWFPSKPCIAQRIHAHFGNVVNIFAGTVLLHYLLHWWWLASTTVFSDSWGYSDEGSVTPIGTMFGCHWPILFLRYMLIMARRFDSNLKFTTSLKRTVCKQSFGFFFLFGVDSRTRKYPVSRFSDGKSCTSCIYIQSCL